MFKLLPEEARAKVKRAYVERRAAALLLSLITVLLIGMAGLFPAYVLSKAKKLEVSERLRVAGSPILDSESEESRLWFQKTNLKLERLSPALDKQYASAFIGEVINVRPEGLRLTVLDWTQSGEDMVLSISGIAEDRQTLIDFERALNDSGSFSKVTLPVSNLAKDSNIPFQVKLSPIIKQ